MRKYYIFIATLGAIVASLAIESFMLMGSPFQQKLQAQDEGTLAQINLIKGQIESYYAANNTLPKKLSDMDEYLSNTGYPKHEYIIKSSSAYQLCANFITDNRQDPRPAQSYAYTGAMDAKHGKGWQCLDFTLPEYIKGTRPAQATTPILTPFEAEEQILKATCSGQLKNGYCAYPGCMYKYPMDTHTKGGAISTSGSRADDNCENGRNDVSKYYCTPKAGNPNEYAMASRIFICEKGCANGACIK